MGIIDVNIACSFDESQEYCTYDNPEYIDKELQGYSLMIVVPKIAEMQKDSSFIHIENLIERVISHETIHVVITVIEGMETSDKLDDLELSFPLGGRTHIIRMNFLGYADDNTGLVTTNL